MKLNLVRPVEPSFPFNSGVLPAGLAAKAVCILWVGSLGLGAGFCLSTGDHAATLTLVYPQDILMVLALVPNPLNPINPISPIGPISPINPISPEPLNAPKPSEPKAALHRPSTPGRSILQAGIQSSADVSSRLLRNA